MLSGRAGQALGTDPAAKKSVHCKKKRSRAIRAAADGRMAGIRHVRSWSASLRTWALCVLMPGHAAHDFGPEPTASELKSKVADAQTRSGVWRCHPSLENHRSEGRQAGTGANRHSADYMYGFAFATRCWGYLTSAGENTHQCRQTLVSGEYTSRGSLHQN